MKLVLKELFIKILTQTTNIKNFDGTNCHAKYIHVGNIVVAYLWQTERVAVYTGLPKPIQTVPYMYGLGSVFRDATVGGHVTADGYSNSSGGIAIALSGATSGHNYVSTIAYLTDEAEI